MAAKNSPERQKAELARYFTQEIPYCPWVPNEGPQEKFLLDFTMELLFGGAVGGGKSIALMMAASQFLQVPNYSALLLRKSHSEGTKPGAIMDIAGEWWGGTRGCRYRAQENTWEFECPGGGTSEIVFGYLAKDTDRFHYAGGRYVFVGFDEVAEFKERDYRFLFSRMRKVADPRDPLAHVPLRMRASANPGGTHGEWVYRRFIEPNDAFKRGLAPKPDCGFIPSFLHDNPKINAQDYIKSLDHLDPITREQLLHGDWHIRPQGRMFKAEWFKPIALSEVPGNCKWVRFWDMAATEADPGKDPDYTAGCLLGRSPDGKYYIADMQRWREEPAMNDARIRAVIAHDTKRVSQAMEQEPGSAGKTQIYHFRTRVFEGYSFRGVPASGGKTIRAMPIASRADAGDVHIVNGHWNDAFLDEVSGFPDLVHDDQIDALSHAYSVLARIVNTNIRFGTGENLDFERASPWRPEATPANLTPELANYARQSMREKTFEEIRAAVSETWAI